MTTLTARSLAALAVTLASPGATAATSASRPSSATPARCPSATRARARASPRARRPTSSTRATPTSRAWSSSATASGDVAGTDNHEIRSLTLGGETLVDDGVRLDVATRVVRIAFAPSGRFAIVLGKTGDGPDAFGVVASVRVDDAGSMSVVDSVELPIFGPEDLHVASTLDADPADPAGQALRVYVVDHDSTAGTGVHALRLACDGALAPDPGAFHEIRLADSMAFLGDDRALLVGGQAAFDPSTTTTCACSRSGDDTGQVAAFDVFTDFIDLTRIAADRAGTRVVVPTARRSAPRAAPSCCSG